MTTDQSLTDAVDRITAQLDTRGNPDLAGLPETLCRALKVQEEAGEMAQAVIGVLGQNPRKGVTHTWRDVVNEAIDVAMSALVFAETVDPGNLGTTLAGRLDYLRRRAAASGAPDTAGKTTTSAEDTEVVQRRNATLRWLLAAHTDHGLPLPQRIDMRLHTLELQLNPNCPDGVRRWAALLGVPVTDPKPVTASSYQWNEIKAVTPWDSDPTGLGWSRIEVETMCDFQPITAAAPTVVAA